MTSNRVPTPRPLYGDPVPVRRTYLDTESGSYKSVATCTVKTCNESPVQRLRIGDPQNRDYFFACSDHRSLPMSVSESLPCNSEGYVERP